MQQKRFKQNPVLCANELQLSTSIYSLSKCLLNFEYWSQLHWTHLLSSSFIVDSEDACDERKMIQNQMQAWIHTDKTAPHLHNSPLFLLIFSLQLQFLVLEPRSLLLQSTRQNKSGLQSLKFAYFQTFQE